VACPSVCAARRVTLTVAPMVDRVPMSVTLGERDLRRGGRVSLPTHGRGAGPAKLPDPLSEFSQANPAVDLPRREAQTAVVGRRTSSPTAGSILDFGLATVARPRDSRTLASAAALIFRLDKAPGCRS
jgi:hypothetical protein